MKHDKLFATACAGALCAFGGAAEIPVEWGMNWPVDVPYEICVNTAKLARAGYAAPWSVMADGGNGATALPVAVLEGDHDGEARLRFNVPAGTKRITRRLSCSAPERRTGRSRREGTF